ncbi:MAG: hypothetical protein H6836_04945 [Planctomycetes bacterium]|nr:hypothetical protein [Planctomycetota bacterium]
MTRAALALLLAESVTFGSPLAQAPTPTADAARVAVIALPADVATERLNAVGLTTMAQFASRFVTPPLCRDQEIQALGNRALVGVLQPDQERWVRDFVARNTARTAPRLEVEASLYTVGDAAYRKLVAPLLSRGTRYAVLAAGKKTDDYAVALSKVRGATLITAPRLLVYPAQRASLSVRSQTSYVDDFVPQFDKATGKPVDLEPVLAIVHDGVTMECTCALLADELTGGFAGLDVHVHFAQLQRPIRTVRVNVAGCPKQIEIGVPEVDVAEVRAAARVPLGGAVLLELPRAKNRIVVILRVTANPAAEAR